MLDAVALIGAAAMMVFGCYEVGSAIKLKLPKLLVAQGIFLTLMGLAIVLMILLEPGAARTVFVVAVLLGAGGAVVAQRRLRLRDQRRNGS